MTDSRTDTRRGLPDLVKMLDMILTAAEWRLLVSLIEDCDRDRQQSTGTTS